MKEPKNIYPSCSTTIQNDEYELNKDYKHFECQECGHKHYSLDVNPECPYCETKNSIKIEG